MRFNFRKISAMAASAVMLVSTAGIAAAVNYPSPFVTANTASAGIVIGTGASILDSVQAANVKTDLDSRTGTTTISTTTCTGGDCFLIELASTKLNMNDTLKSVRSSDIGEDELPNLLAELEYKAGNSKSYGYEQKITLAGSSTTGLTYNTFADNDFNDKKPSIGIKVKDNTDILNLTITWTGEQPETDVDSAKRLKDLEDSEITILGRKYTILNAYNSSENSGRTKLELMGGAIVDSVDFGETGTHSLEGKSYAVRLAHIEDTEVKICVSIDSAADECDSNLAKGETFELSDGIQVGVRNINYVSKTGRTDSVDFSLGANKLTLEDNQTVEVNDDDVTGLKVEVPYAGSGSKVKLGNIKFMWTADDDIFISGDNEIEIPALGGLKISSGGFYTPTEETIKVQNSGGKGVELIIPIKDGTATVPLLYGSNNASNPTAWGYIGGDDDDDSLNTGNVTSSVNDDTPEIWYNDTAGDRYFVASWNSSTDSESYFLQVADISPGTDDKNETDIKNVVTGEVVCSDKREGDTCTLGNVVLTFGETYDSGDQVQITLNSGASINRIYSKEGAVFYLPVQNNGTGSGATVADVFANPSIYNFNITNGLAAGRGAEGGGPVSGNASSYVLQMFEEDKDNNLAKGGNINFTLNFESDGDTRVNSVRGVWSSSTALTADPGLETEEDSEKYVEWIKSDLATKVQHNRESSTQFTAEVTYHGDETFGKVYLADTNADISQISQGTKTVSTGDFVLVTDNEVSSVASKDLIIIGGSCINTAAANVLGVPAQTCDSAWEAKTGVGSGEFLIESFGDKYATGKVALLVAGYNAEDTELAAKTLVDEAESIDTTAGTKYIGGISAELTKVVATA